MSLGGKVCVVTGASSGIGRQTALDLAGEGARVCIAARRRDRLEELLAEMGGAERGHSLCVTDVSDREQVRALVTHVTETYGRLDVLINNAGFGSDSLFESPEDIAEVEKVMATNFFGTIYVTGEFLPLLRESTPSHIVTVASVAGRLAAGGAATYCASKFALVGFFESLSYDLAEQDIYVSLVEPGFIPTEGFPQADMTRDPVFKHMLGTVQGVSDAIRQAIEHRKVQRVTPRWYYLLQFPRLVSPPLYRLIYKKIAAPRQRKRIEAR